MSLWTAIVRRPEHRLGNWNAKSNYSVWQLATFAVDPFVWTGFSVFKWERLFS
jgi:hypothetical protein